MTLPIPGPRTSPDVRAEPQVALRGPYFCGGATEETLTGGRYNPEPEMRESDVVWAGGDCKATLEDCVIAGPHSVLVVGRAKLTLRRCSVEGRVQLIGAGTLHLEGTTLAQPPIIMGPGKVIRR